MKHALVVGGSGMLAKASLWLADQQYLVSVIGRNVQKLNRLTQVSKNVNPISVDYNNKNQLASELQNCVKTYGAYEIVVAWIHHHEKQIIDIIRSENRIDSHAEWRLFHVLGSGSNPDEMKREIGDIGNCVYHQVQLGYVMENNRSRWLTHDEISDGVINAIRTNAKQYFVGIFKH